MAPPVYPELTIYVVRDESGKLEPVAVSLGGFTLPVLRATIVADPNAVSHGSRALVGEVSFPIGGGGIEEIGSVEEIPDLAPISAEAS